MKLARNSASFTMSQERHVILRVSWWFNITVWHKQEISRMRDWLYISNGESSSRFPSDIRVHIREKYLSQDQIVIDISPNNKAPVSTRVDYAEAVLYLGYCYSSTFTRTRWIQVNRTSSKLGWFDTHSPIDPKYRLKTHVQLALWVFWLFSLIQINIGQSVLSTFYITSGVV